MTHDQTPPPAPRPGPTWPTPPGPPAAPRPQGFGVPSPAVPKKRHPVLTHGAAALVALFIGVGIGHGGGSADDGKEAAASATTSPATAASATTAPSQAPTAAPSSETATTETPTTEPPKPATVKPAVKPAVKPKPTAKPGPPTSFDGDGEYLVGQDVAAGTYRTAGPADFGCYWERDKDSSGEFESIIANDNLSGSGRVTVRKGEVFKTQGCQTWKKVG